MIALLSLLLAVLASPFRSKCKLVAENALLRHQVLVLRRKVKGRVSLTNGDRWFFVQLYRWFPSILPVLAVIQPETLVRWHQGGFRLYWRWKSRPYGGRPQIEAELRALIRRISIENPLWGAPRIHGELLKLGFDVALMRREMGSSLFSAQYQQRPIPQGGALLQSEWFGYYGELPERQKDSYILQSWDTAPKQGLLNSFSVCTTWMVKGHDYYLIDVVRQKLTYPALRDMAIALAERYKPRHILIEDAMTGMALADELASKFSSAIKRIKPEGDKQVRLYVQQAKFEQGRVWFPKEAPWLRIFLEELLSFPESRHSDQVDSVSQALAYKGSGYNLDNLSNLSDLIMGLHSAQMYGMRW